MEKLGKNAFTPRHVKIYPAPCKFLHHVPEHATKEIQRGLAARGVQVLVAKGVQIFGGQECPELCPASWGAITACSAGFGFSFIKPSARARSAGER